MRIRSTLPFSTALASYERSYANWQRRREPIGNYHYTEADIDRLKGGLISNVDDVLKTPAITDRDVIAKLNVMLEHVDDDDRAFGWSNIDHDIKAMARPAPGPDMLSAFKAWRAAWWDMSVHDCASERDEGDENHLNAILSAAFASVLRVPCTTPGDFMVKAYVHLLWHAGHVSDQLAREAGTGNFFDIDLGEIDSNSLLGDAYFRSVYDDLNHSDLGACLLAYGSTDFEPEEWMLAADRIGMAVTVMQKEGGEQGISIGMVESHEDRLMREERRLQRILAHDFGSRAKQLAGYLTSHRPDCVLLVPARVAI